eukprot:9457731-Ditylum_brightwellii.AAC.1
MELFEKAKTIGSTVVDLVNVQDTQKFTRHQIHYMKKLVKQVKNLSGTDGKLICQEVNNKETGTSVSSEVKSKMVIGTAWTHTHLRRIIRAFGDILFVDATEETNDKESPMLTVSA